MTLFSRVFRKIRKELMLVVSIVAAIISLFITPPSKELLKAIDWHTLATLFMLLTVLEGFKQENIFMPIIRKTSSLGSMFSITTFFVFAVFLSSMFVTNDVSLIIFVPLTITLFRKGNKEKYILPVLTLENIAAIRGSLLTPFGSPQNLFLFTQSGVSAGNFILHMFPLWITSAVLLLIFIAFLYRKDIKEKIENNTSDEELNHTITDKSKRKIKNTYKISFIFLIIMIVSRTKYWPIFVAIITITLLIIDRKIFLKTDYILLLTFLCFFIFSSSIAANPSISAFLKNTVTGNEYWWSIGLSQIVSNVPASIILWPFTENLTALLYGLDTAGLCSIIGSLASVINYRIYTKATPIKGSGKSFIKTFQIISLAFFAIVVVPQYFLSVWQF